MVGAIADAIHAHGVVAAVFRSTLLRHPGHITDLSQVASCFADASHHAAAAATGVIIATAHEPTLCRATTKPRADADAGRAVP